MKFKFDITDIDLTNIEAKSLSRDVDISQHLPQDIIGKGLEFQEIRKVENIELTNLWQNINSVLNNMFIHLADERGISYYERLLEIDPEGSLEERRQKVFSLWNRRIIWTHRSLEEWLNESLGKENYKIELIYDEYIAEFVIYMDQTIEFKRAWLEKELRKIIPANLIIRWRLVFVQNIYIGMTAISGKKRTHFPLVVKDRIFNHEIFYGMAITRQKKKRVFKKPDVFTTNYINMMLEVEGEGKVKLDYE